MPLTIVTCNLLLTTNNLTIAHDKYHQYLNQDELYSASFDTAVLYTWRNSASRGVIKGSSSLELPLPCTLIVLRAQAES